MRELPGVNELHKSNNEYNKDVALVIKMATQATNARELIDVLNGGKRLEDIARQSEQKIVIKEEDMENLPKKKIIIREEDILGDEEEER